WRDRPRTRPRRPAGGRRPRPGACWQGGFFSPRRGWPHLIFETPPPLALVPPAPPAPPMAWFALKVLWLTLRKARPATPKFMRSPPSPTPPAAPAPPTARLAVNVLLLTVSVASRL